jgi:hypothetical protein
MGAGMTAARIALRLVRKPSDLIGEALFWRMEYFEARPVICFAGLVMTIVLAGILEQLP